MVSSGRARGIGHRACEPSRPVARAGRDRGFSACAAEGCGHPPEAGRSALGLCAQARHEAPDDPQHEAADDDDAGDVFFHWLPPGGLAMAGPRPERSGLSPARRSDVAPSSARPCKSQVRWRTKRCLPALAPWVHSSGLRRPDSGLQPGSHATDDTCQTCAGHQAPRIEPLPLVVPPVPMIPAPTPCAHRPTLTRR